MSVLECLQLSGDIPVGGTAHIEFVLSPLEVKKYTVSTATLGVCLQASLLHGVFSDVTVNSNVLII